MRSGGKGGRMFMSEDWYGLFVTWAKSIELPDSRIIEMVDHIIALRIYEVLSPRETAWLFANPWEFEGWCDRGGEIC